MEKNKREKSIISVYNLNEYPEELKKKVALLQYFKAFLETDVEISLCEFDNRLPVYVKK